MTKLNRSVTRVVSTTHGQVVVTIGPGDYIGFRFYRCRKTYDLTLGHCLLQAIVAEQRITLKAKRSRKRKRQTKRSILK